MKKTLLIVAVAGLALVSCKKDRTCECTRTSTYSNGTTSVSSTDPVETITLKEVKGGEAKTLCQKMTSTNTYSTTTNTSVNDCKLK